MKKIYYALAILIAGLSMSLHAEERSAEAAEFHQRLLLAMNADENEKALDLAEKELAALKRQSTPTDSLQVDAILHQGVLYRRMKRLEKAIEIDKQGIDILKLARRDSTEQMAKLYDNIALYYTLLEDTEHALEYSQQSVNIIYALHTNSFDMGISLMRAAEVSYMAKKYDDAALYQQQALNIFEQKKGIHSNLYISETGYLSKYLNAAGRKEEAEKVDELVEKLKRENRFGYVPMPADLSSAEKCKIHNEDAFYAAAFYLSHFLNDSTSQYVFSYLRDFSMNSSDIMLPIGPGEAEWASDTAAIGYLGSYMAAYIKIQLNSKDRSINFDDYASAYDMLTEHYKHNRKLSGEIAALERLLTLKEQKPKKYLKKLQKNFTPIAKGKISTEE